LTWNACSQGPLGLGNDSSTTLTTTGSGETLDLAALQRKTSNIMTSNCASCHTATSGPGNAYNLSDLNYLVTSGLVIAGQPGQSPLYQQISLGLMPPGGGLYAGDKAIVHDWIVALSVSPGATPTP